MFVEALFMAFLPYLEAFEAGFYYWVEVGSLIHKGDI